jgi:hypothetical protein
MLNGRSDWMRLAGNNQQSYKTQPEKKGKLKPLQ